MIRGVAAALAGASLAATAAFAFVDPVYTCVGIDDEGTFIGCARDVRPIALAALAGAVATSAWPKVGAVGTFVRVVVIPAAFGAIGFALGAVVSVDWAAFGCIAGLGVGGVCAFYWLMGRKK